MEGPLLRKTRGPLRKTLEDRKLPRWKNNSPKVGRRTSRGGGRRCNKSIGTPMTNTDSHTLRWGPYLIQVLRKPSLSEDNCYGVYNGQPPRMQVEVLTGLDGPMEAATTFHELVHAVDELLGIGLSEKAVRGIEVGLTGLLRENPEWSRAWLEQLLSDE